MIFLRGLGWVGDLERLSLAVPVAVEADGRVFWRWWRRPAVDAGHDRWTRYQRNHIAKYLHDSSAGFAPPDVVLNVDQIAFAVGAGGCHSGFPWFG